MSERALTSIAIAPGPWSPHGVLSGRPRTLLVVLDGLLMREITLAGVPSAELRGPGDLVVHLEGVDSSLPQATTWTVLSDARIGIIDMSSAPSMPNWPQLSGQLLGDLATQLRRSSEMTAIGHLPRVEDRVVGLMWHLAERFGRVTGVGTVVPVALTHASIGRLVGARRPTVSLALKQLSAIGSVVRRDDGSWLLSEQGVRVLHAALPVNGSGASAP